MKKDKVTVLSARCSKTSFIIETTEIFNGTEFDSIYYYYDKEKNTKVEDNITKDILLKVGAAFIYPGSNENYGI